SPRINTDKTDQGIARIAGIAKESKMKIIAKDHFGDLWHFWQLLNPCSSVVRFWKMPEQTVFPMIAYEDAAAAMDWLVRAFGFTERRRMADQQGRVVHGELELSGNIVMVASPTPEYRSPKSHTESCEQARRWSAVPWVIDGVLVFVDDVDAHY